jgi:hypothetical protein
VPDNTAKSVIRRWHAAKREGDERKDTQWSLSSKIATLKRQDHST